MSIGLFDLSIVTDQLIQLLTERIANTPLWKVDGNEEKFNVSVTGLAPDVAHKGDGCQLSLYLFHVSADSSNRNTYPTGGQGRTVPEQPLGLVLHYLLSAHSPTKYVEEQQAMSVGLQCFHENPIIDVTVPPGRMERMTLTLERQTIDEIGRLWQSTSAPLRMSAVYRVGVAILQPPEPSEPRGVVLKAEFVPPATDPSVAKGVVFLDGAPRASATPISASAQGLVIIPGRGFASDSTRVFLRVLAIPETASDPPEPGCFRIVSPTALAFQLPVGTPAGEYCLRVWPDPDRPAIEFLLGVP